MLTTVSALVVLNVALKWISLRSRAEGTDSYFHLLYAAAIRQNGHRIPPDGPSGTLRERSDYPWLYHWILSFFTPSWIRDWGHWIGIFASSALLAAIVVVTWLLAAAREAPLIPAVVVAGLSYILSPGSVNRWSGMHGISPRPVAILFVSLWIFAVLIPETHPSKMAPLIAATFAAIIFLLSKFGTQCLLFGALGMALITWSVDWLFAPFAGFAIGIVLSRGKILTVVRGHVRHSVFYARQLQWSHVAMIRNRSLSELIGLIAGGLSFQQMLYAVYHTTIVRGLVYQPFAGLAILLIVLSNDARWIGSLSQIVMVAVTVGCITTFRPLRFLGEGDRYLQFMALAPASVLCGLLVPEMSNVGLALWIGAATTGIGVWIVDLRAQAAKGTSIGEEDLREISIAVKDSQQMGSILCIPLNFGYAVEYVTQHRSVFWPGNVSERVVKEDFAFLFPPSTRFPYPRRDLESLVHRYDVELIIVFLKHVNMDVLGPLGIDVSYDMTNFDEVERRDGWALYKIPIACGPEVRTT